LKELEEERELGLF